MEERNGTFISTCFSLETIGFITWIVFLVLKLCNQSFDWLTWFWVWFPLWAPIALDLVLLGIFIGVFFIIEFVFGD